MRAEHELRADTEVASSTPDTPEEICIFGLGRLDDLTVGKSDPGG